eukprot:Hpha_TRINITY_DN16541_c0_g1::TRINITY_DN16541_c0_g1_i2::g.135994::m.135994
MRQCSVRAVRLAPFAAATGLTLACALLRGLALLNAKLVGLVVDSIRLRSGESLLDGRVVVKVDEAEFTGAESLPHDSSERPEDGVDVGLLHPRREAGHVQGSVLVLLDGSRSAGLLRRILRRAALLGARLLRLGLRRGLLLLLLLLLLGRVSTTTGDHALRREGVRLDGTGHQASPRDRSVGLRLRRRLLLAGGRGLRLLLRRRGLSRSRGRGGGSARLGARDARPRQGTIRLGGGRGGDLRLSGDLGVVNGLGVLVHLLDGLLLRGGTRRRAGGGRAGGALRLLGRLGGGGGGTLGGVLHRSRGLGLLGAQLHQVVMDVVPLGVGVTREEERVVEILVALPHEDSALRDHKDGVVDRRHALQGVEVELTLELLAAHLAEEVPDAHRAKDRLRRLVRSVVAQYRRARVHPDDLLRRRRELRVIVLHEGHAAVQRQLVLLVHLSCFLLGVPGRDTNGVRGIG